MEAPPGIEPGMEVLQTSALPLGDGAVVRAFYSMKDFAATVRTTRRHPRRLPLDGPFL